ncbi:AraC family transcriptional regulator [Zhongshania marina]|uniref:AraC family transcriptional regulator n=1 Tax=Zhongshania marina TaxID=2304603 RepID=A0ABX9W5V3_9GAMM|nr:AraC family transcriptional regulator [Zhongshania marina]
MKSNNKFENVTVNMQIVREMTELTKLPNTIITSAMSKSGIGSNLLSHPDTRIPFKNFARLFRRLSSLSKDESLGMLERPLPNHFFSLAVDLAISSSTIYEALCRVSSLSYVSSCSAKIKAIDVKDGVRFQIIFEESESLESFFIQWYLLFLFHSLAWLTGRQIPIKRAGFHFKNARRYRDLDYLYACPCEFNIDGPNYIELDDSVICLPVRRSQAESHYFKKRFPQNLIFRCATPDSLSSKVQSIISQRLGYPSVSRSETAALLNMSEETLRRKLRSEGLSFQQIKDEVRRDTAVAMLASRNVTITTVAENLGFSTPGAFSRAFKSWLGISPENYIK